MPEEKGKVQVGCYPYIMAQYYLISIYKILEFDLELIKLSLSSLSSPISDSSCSFVSELNRVLLFYYLLNYIYTLTILIILKTLDMLLSLNLLELCQVKFKFEFE